MALTNLTRQKPLDLIDILYVGIFKQDLGRAFLFQIRTARVTPRTAGVTGVVSLFNQLGWLRGS